MSVRGILKPMIRGSVVLSSIQLPEIDPPKLGFAEKIGHRLSRQSLSSDPGKSHAAEETGLPWLIPACSYDPREFDDPDEDGCVQSHYCGSDPGKFHGMSGAGAGKGKDGEPTKDDERTLAWKLRVSVEAVTPKFMASAMISLEKKSG